MSKADDQEDTNGWVIRAEVRLRQESRGFIEVSKSEWFIVLLGMTIGVGFILIPHYFSSLLDQHHTTGLVIEHLGLGFIVSSIAVFGYEWRSHARNVIELSKKLHKSLEDVERIRKTMILSKAQVDVLTTSAEEALDSSLKVYIGEDWAALREDLKALINAVYHVQQHKTWVRDRYLKVVQWLLHESVVDNAQSFVYLTDQHPHGEQHFKVPIPPKIADQILTTQMELMERGDTYDVISDITSWRDNALDEFRKESLRALLEGVKVRRVFNRFRLDLPISTDPAYGEMCKKTADTLREHLRYSKEYRGYEIRILGPTELVIILKQEKGNPIFTRDRIERHISASSSKGVTPTP